MRPVPINESEAVFERFMDPLRSEFAKWRYAADPETGAAASQFWCAVQIQWAKGNGRTVARLSRELALKLEGYDHLILRMALPASARLTVRVRLDGKDLTPIPAVQGKNTQVEYEGPLAGAILEKIEIEITDSSATPGMSLILWLGLFHKARRAAMLSRPGFTGEMWADLLLPAEQTKVPEPSLGLFFGREELDALRHKVSKPPYDEIFRNLRKMARAHLADEPWRGVADICGGGGLLGRSRDSLTIDPLAMRLGAFVGLIDADPALLRMALHHALAAAHCQYWANSFMEIIPGTAWESRAFNAYRVGCNLIFAWDWAGSYLTDAGKAVLAQAVAMKGLSWLLMSLMRYDYVRECNQGAYFAYGAIICEAALARSWPAHGGELIETAKAAMDETMNRYIAEDGGAFEGMGYYSSTIGHALVGYQAYARLKGLPLETIVPERIRKVPNYLTAMLSTVPPLGSAVPVADGGRPGVMLFPECLGSLCQLSDDKALPALLQAILPVGHEKENYATPGWIFNIIHGPDSLPAAEVRPPVFRVLPQTGMLCSCRPTPQGQVRLQLIGAPAGAGHCHEDKGSFVIEAFGEELAIERGQMAYDDPRCQVIKYACYHNLLIPDMGEALPAHQVNPCPAAVLPEGRGDETSLACSVDASGVYPDLAALWQRTIESKTPLEFLITDVMELKTPGTVAFHLHSHFPWEKSQQGWATRGQKAELLVAPQWQALEERGEEDFIDGRKEPAYHLTLRAPPGARHELRTVLTIRPA